jgi:hypothetical protein
VGNGFGLAGESSMGICGMGGGRKRKQGKEGITSFFCIGRNFRICTESESSGEYKALSFSLHFYIFIYWCIFPNSPSNMFI